MADRRVRNVFLTRASLAPKVRGLYTIALPIEILSKYYVQTSLANGWMNTLLKALDPTHFFYDQRIFDSLPGYEPAPASLLEQTRRPREIRLRTSAKVVFCCVDGRLADLRYKNDNSEEMLTIMVPGPDPELRKVMSIARGLDGYAIVMHGSVNPNNVDLAAPTTSADCGWRAAHGQSIKSYIHSAMGNFYLRHRPNGDLLQVHNLMTLF